MKVLIVEDYYDSARSLMENFRIKGYDAEFFLHSSGVVAFASEKKPDWMVLDIQMPPKSGLQVFKELNEKADFEFSVVFYSNYTDDPIIVKEMEALNIPEKAVISKTVDLDNDISEKLIPALEAGYLRGGKKNGGRRL